MRKMAYKRSSLPYSFSYKIKRAFEGRICPVCNVVMTSTYKSAMPTIQHNIPISKGVEHELDNISVICESCNTSIQDTETGALNNADVIEVWEKIIEAEKRNIKWFWNPKLLDDINDGQVTDTCQAMDGHGTDNGRHRLGKDRLGKVSSGKDRLGEVIVCSEPQSAPEPEADTALIPLNDGSGWRPSLKDFEEWQRIYPNVDVSREIERMRQWCLSNPSKRKTKRGIRRFVTNWLDGEQNKPRKQVSKLDAMDAWAEDMKRRNNEESGIF
jgi:transcription elongation factor Elf1